MKKYPTVTIRIDQELLDRLETAVEERNYKTKSAYILDAIRWQIESDEESEYGWEE